ncbi:hypothetical protein VitviT2T_023490 [Vitis vinifera]|uniref:Small ribosomal subunit protein uS15 N-terminal domain-containing protein n=3 Tax=Vitis TaxID=3603 RepID=A0ABY9DCW5_VITVI|nr:hypothetical protein VitviT2T_023490 [Vitis vinifera]
MGRMHSRGKGISSSALPYKRTPPSWLKISSQDVEENICKFAKKGMTPSQIGVILRDSHGIAQVKSVTGSKILRILKAHGLAPEIPEDLYHLIKKAVAIRKHLERNRKDKDSKFRLILVESRIHRLARYYKRTKKLPPVWKYESTTASTLRTGGTAKPPTPPHYYNSAIFFKDSEQKGACSSSLNQSIFSTNMAKSYFKQEHEFEKRRAEAARIRDKYPERIPVIVEKAERSDIPNIDKKKYLVPADLTVGQFVYVIRKRIKLSAEKAIFIFVDNVLPPTGAIMSAIYDEKKDADGFLYVTYSGENTFGYQISPQL